MKHLKINFATTGIFPFLGKARQIVNSLEANAVIYPSPHPALADLQVMIDELTTLAIAAESGDRQKKALKNALREILTENLIVLAAYCENMAAGDKDKLIASGFTLIQSRRRIGSLPAVKSLVVKFTGKAGEVSLKWKRLYGAKSYMIYGRKTGEPATTFKHLGICTRSRYAIKNLTPGIWEFRVIALGTAGQSPPGNITTVPVV